ncbi:dihydrodipicolinate synthase family protein [Paenibacillus oceani]|uniref:dihydrodipicolinate synthase family protein n=1 Tax=Paenibacillus oceani TaxID=2772510 RepID=UPI001CC23AE2|nr:dihydrodipicolinate synthase family protein [Paenibacillus oceani]
MKEIANGVWPTMITPFTEDKQVDYNGLEQLIEWYISQGVDGLFAVCQSSEMFFLSLEERVKMARFVKEKAGSRVPVIASGHVSDDLEGQIEEIRQIAATGIDAFVIVTNRFAKEEESDEVWISRAQTILENVPGVSFGLYECPYPYKRLLSPQVLSWCASTGRFLFLKDTSCSETEIEAKLEAVKGSSLKLFNANTATLLASLRLGAAGFSGVMANMHPDLYVWLTRNWSAEPQKAETLQAFLSTASLIELQIYPVNAKYYQQQLGLPIALTGRSKDASTFTATRKLEVNQLAATEQAIREHVSLPRPVYAKA